MFTPSLRMNFCGSPRAATGARGEPMTSAPPMEWVTEEVSDALGGIGFDTHHIRRPERGGECWHTTTAASRPDPAIFSTARPHYIQHDMGSDSTYSAAQKSAKNADCSYGPGVHVGTVRAPSQHPRAPAASPRHLYSLWSGSCGCKTRSATLV